MKRKKITKKKIIEAAVIVAEEDGFNAITLKSIATQLDIKIPSLYNHISGLAEVYDLLAYEGLQQLLAQITNAVTGLSGRSALHSMGIAYYTFACQSSIIYQAAQQPHLWTSEQTKKLSTEIVALCAKIIAIFDYSEERTIHIIRSLRSYLHGFSILAIQESFQLPIATDKSFIFGFDALLDGLKIE